MLPSPGVMGTTSQLVKRVRLSSEVVFHRLACCAGTVRGHWLLAARARTSQIVKYQLCDCLQFMIGNRSVGHEQPIRWPSSLDQ
jgi:hypothetical protein